MAIDKCIFLDYFARLRDFDSTFTQYKGFGRMNDKKKKLERVRGIVIAVIIAIIGFFVVGTWLLGGPGPAVVALLLIGVAAVLLVVASIMIKASREPREPKK